VVVPQVVDAAVRKSTWIVHTAAQQSINIQRELLVAQVGLNKQCIKLHIKLDRRLNVFKSQHYFIASIAVLLTVLFVLATPALAIHPDAKSEIDNLKRRIEALESQETSSTQAEDQVHDFGQISKYITLHGLLEAEAYYAKDC
jgi:hypothetical protein